MNWAANLLIAAAIVLLAVKVAGVVFEAQKTFETFGALGKGVEVGAYIAQADINLENNSVDVVASSDVNLVEGNMEEYLRENP